MKLLIGNFMKTLLDYSLSNIQITGKLIKKQGVEQLLTSNNKDIRCVISIYPTGIVGEANSNCESFLDSYFPEGHEGYASVRTDFTVDGTPVFQIRRLGQSIWQIGGKFGPFFWTMVCFWS